MAGAAARGCDGLCHAGAVLPLGPHAALHRRAGQRRRGPRGDRAPAIPTRGWMAPASPGCARPASRSMRACCSDEADERGGGVPRAGSPGPSAGDAEARLDAGRPDRHAVGREPLDHRRGRAPCGPRAARPARRGDGRRRHGAGGRSGADLPAARLPAQPGGAGRGRQPPAHPAHRDARRHRRGSADLDADPRRHRSRAPARLRRSRCHADRGRRAPRPASIRSRALAALGEAGLTRCWWRAAHSSPPRCCAADLVDRIAWFHAPAVMGGDAWPAVQAFGIERAGRHAALPRAWPRRRSATTC